VILYSIFFGATVFVQVLPSAHRGKPGIVPATNAWDPAAGSAAISDKARVVWHTPGLFLPLHQVSPSSE
jgi:hypothetical protein